MIIKKKVICNKIIILASNNFSGLHIFQFYPDLYENRTGSLVPFSLRLLIAELPMHVNKPEEAMDRLYAMLSVIEQVNNF